jgi:hypothetical protein
MADKIASKSPGKGQQNQWQDDDCQHRVGPQNRQIEGADSPSSLKPCRPVMVVVSQIEIRNSVEVRNALPIQMRCAITLRFPNQKPARHKQQCAGAVQSSVEMGKISRSHTLLHFQTKIRTQR